MKPIKAGSLPKCVMLENIATLVLPSLEIVAMRLADLASAAIDKVETLNAVHFFYFGAVYTDQRHR